MLLLLAVACAEGDDPPDKEPEAPCEAFADADGDGHGDPASVVACGSGTAAAGDDCDDADPAVHPDAAEACDGVDQDCDGVVDEDVGDTWYLDGDGDGYGLASTAVIACAPGEGHVADASDCDDAAAAVHPGAAEVCDGVDNDCDALVDDADPDVTGRTAWYADADGDGLGDPDASVEACEAPEGYVPNDDEDCAENPAWGWADGDCDGRPGIDAEGADATYTGTTRDGYVGLTLSAEDVDGDGYRELFAAGSASEGVLGSVWVVDGATLASSSGGRIATRVVAAEATGTDAADRHRWLFDVDGDGARDFFVSEPWSDAGAVEGGAAYVLTSVAIADALAAGTTLTLDADARVFQGTDAEGHAGALFGAAGDVDGDGVSELAIGSAGTDVTYGEAWLFRGVELAPGSPLEPADAWVRVRPANWGDFLAYERGEQVGADFDGDGLADVVLAERDADTGATRDGGEGILYLYTGAGLAGGGERVTTDADVQWQGNLASAGVGSGVTVAPDYTGDGVPELFVNGDYYGAAAYVLDGADLFGGGSTRSMSEGWLGFRPTVSDSMLGWVLEAPGDLDGDGEPDLVVTDPLTDEEHYGRAYVFLAGRLAAGRYDTNTADAVLTGNYFGWSVAGLGDLDGSGTDDLAFGSLAGASNEGEVYVFRSRW